MTERYDSDPKEESAPLHAFRLDPDDPAHAGQAAYTPAMLRAYDAVVVRLSNSYVWRCPAKRILAHYDRHVTGTHLDVGPGTGYYLDRCRFPEEPSLTLVDPNPDVLAFAGRRLDRYHPTLHPADVLKPLDLAPGSFGSVGASYVLHCLPGDIDAKAVALDHLRTLVAPGGVVFGTTILATGVDHTRLGRKLMAAYNARGIFSNRDDDLGALARTLADRFDRHEVEVVGAVALFAGFT